LEIHPHMLSYVYLQKIPNRYLVYPPDEVTDGVIQNHLRGKKVDTLTVKERKALMKASDKEILNPKSEVLKSAVEKTAGASNHEDLRIRIGDHLVGFSIVGLEWPKEFFGEPGVGYRAETKCVNDYCDEWMYEVESIDEEKGIVKVKWKSQEELSQVDHETLASQPLVWLNVQGYVPPGEVGAAKEGGGFFRIRSRLKVVCGALKPNFLEYFIKSKEKDGPFPDWTRVIFRLVKVPVMGPDKKPIKGVYEVMIRAMVPKDQTPYCMSKRARQKGWVPPKGVIPIPPEWRKGEEYEEWLKWVKEKWGETSKLSRGQFTLHLNHWKGPPHIRNLPEINYYLHIKTPDGDIRTFWLSGDPIRVSPLAAIEEDPIDPDMFRFEGEVKPLTRFNPNREIPAFLDIVDKGSVDYVSSFLDDGREVLTLTFHGKYLTGKFEITQTEKGSEYYEMTFIPEGKLSACKWGLRRHYMKNGEMKEHWDLWIYYPGSDHLIEFNLYKDPRKTQVGEDIMAYRKTCPDLSWMDIKEPGTVKYVGNLKTYVDPLESGSGTVFNDTDMFMNFILTDGEMSGYWVALRTDTGWILRRSSLPRPTLSVSHEILKERLSGQGDPLSGRPYSPFRIERRRGWDYYRIHLYDLRRFVRCEPSERLRYYLPDLKVPEWIRDINICLYRKPGTFHWARVSYVDVDASIPEEEAVRWIKDNELDKWTTVMYRKS